MTRCGFNECPHGKVKRRTVKFAPGCDPCNAKRAAIARLYRAGFRHDPDENENDNYSELGDYILRRDAAGNLLRPEPKPGCLPFVEVSLSEDAQ